MSQIRNFLASGVFAGALASAAFIHSPAAEAGTERTVYSFCSQQNCTDGRAPLAGLVNVHGLLYGTTSAGGANDVGTVFQVDPKTGAETVLHSFCQSNCSDGWDPVAGLINVHGRLYGTTLYGSINGVGAGTVFWVDPGTGAEKVVNVFEYLYGGIFPYAGLIDVHGKLYGTTADGGAAGGTVFSVDSRTGAETLVASFYGEGPTISNPYAGVIDVGGILYGTSEFGGVTGPCAGNYDGCGTVFSVDPEIGIPKMVHAFQNNNTDGQAPAAGLINVRGILYGTTTQGGEKGGGTVFSVDPKTGAEVLVYSFCSLQNCTDGDEPVAGLINVHGILYGTTAFGGKNRQGTVFSLDPKTGTEAVMYSFCSQQNCADGQNPDAGLINVGGTLYGTTSGGLPNGHGTVFAVTP